MCKRSGRPPLPRDAAMAAPMAVMWLVRVLVRPSVACRAAANILAECTGVHEAHTPVLCYHLALKLTLVTRGLAAN